MNILTLLGYIGLAALSFSVMFVAARVYATYIRKNDNCPQKLGGIGHCSIPVAQPTLKAKKPKRKPVKKRVSAIKDDKLVITPVKKKATTKKVPTKKTPRSKQA